MKMYASIQEGNEVSHSEIKWGFLMCRDTQEGFSVLPVGIQRWNTTQPLAQVNGGDPEEIQAGKKLLFSLKNKRATNWHHYRSFMMSLNVKFWETEQANGWTTATRSPPLVEQLS